MTEKLNSKLTLPAWGVSIIVTVFLTWSIFSNTEARQSIEDAKNQQVYNTKVGKLEEVQKTKADKSDIEWIKAALIRIEGEIKEIKK